MLVLHRVLLIQALLSRTQMDWVAINKHTKNSNTNWMKWMDNRDNRTQVWLKIVATTKKTLLQRTSWIPLEMGPSSNYS